MTRPIPIRARKPQQPAGPRSATDTALEDWDLLFSAVTERLATSLRGAVQPGAAATAQLVVMECLQALEQLQSMARKELGQRELQARALQQTLLQLRGELVGEQSARQQALHLSLHDGLTTLPNRSHFCQRLGQALATPAQTRPALAVLFLDLDGFKPINDRHGHDIGDALLRIVAARLQRNMRSQDMVSRLGGDEFACLLADQPGRERLAELANQLCVAVAAPIRIGALSLTVRASIGIAICPAEGATPATLIKKADAAMYHAKRERSGIAFHDELALHPPTGGSLDVRQPG